MKNLTLNPTCGRTVAAWERRENTFEQKIDSSKCRTRWIECMEAMKKIVYDDQPVWRILPRYSIPCGLWVYLRREKPHRDSFVLDPIVHCIKYLRTLEAVRKIGVDSKRTFRSRPGVLASFPSKKMLTQGPASLFNFCFNFLPLISYTEWLWRGFKVRRPHNDFLR